MLWPAYLQLKSSDPEVRVKAVHRLAEAETLRAFRVLVGTAEDEHPDVRCAVIAAIGQFSTDEATAFLLGKLQDPRPEVREAAVLALRDRQEEQVRLGLAESLRDYDSRVRGRAAQVLDRLRWLPASPHEELWYNIARGRFQEAIAHGSDAIEPLQMVVETGASTLKVAALRALGEIPDERVLKSLLGAIKSDDLNVCVSAIESLANFSSAEINRELVSLLEHSDHRVRVAAIEAVGAAGIPSATPGLIKKLQDPMWDVRSSAAAVLGRIGDMSAVEALVGLLKDPDTDVRYTVVNSLGRLAVPAAIGPLVMALVDSSSNVRHTASTALQSLDPRWPTSDEARQMLPEVRAATSSDDPAVRYAAASVLQQMGEHSGLDGGLEPAGVLTAAAQRHRRVLATFIDLLADADRDLRLAAAESLGRLSDQRAVKPLNTALTDNDEAVRRAAAKSLEFLHFMGAA